MALSGRTTALTGAGQVTFTHTGGNTLVSGRTDADAAAEFFIVLKGTINLTAGDFVL
jgi:hypothetical protein